MMLPGERSIEIASFKCVGHRHQAGCVGADIVALDHVPVVGRGRARRRVDVDAAVGVAADDVPQRARDAADRVVRRAG